MRGVPGTILRVSSSAEAAECPTATKMQHSASGRHRRARMGPSAGRLPATSKRQLHKHAELRIKANHPGLKLLAAARPDRVRRRGALPANKRAPRHADLYADWSMCCRRRKTRTAPEQGAPEDITSCVAFADDVHNRGSRRVDFKKRSIPVRRVAKESPTGEQTTHSDLSACTQPSPKAHQSPSRLQVPRQGGSKLKRKRKKPGRRV